MNIQIEKYVLIRPIHISWAGVTISELSLLKPPPKTEIQVEPQAGIIILSSKKDGDSSVIVIPLSWTHGIGSSSSVERPSLILQQ